MTNLESQFKDLTGLPFITNDSKQYIGDKTYSLSDIGLNINQQEFDDISTKLAQVFDKAQKSISALTEKELKDYCFNPKVIDLIKQSNDELCYMRLGYIVDAKTNELKLIEINSQTPSFNFELEAGTDTLLSLKNEKSRPVKYLVNLTNCLVDNLEQCAIKVNKDLKNCTIGFYTCNSSEDVFEINYLKKIVDSLQLANKTLIVTDNLDFNPEGRVIDNTDGLDIPIDILFNWQPLEWKIDSVYDDGTSFLDLFSKAVLGNKVAIFNGIASFTAQHKYLMNYIQDNELAGPSAKYIATSYYTQDELIADLGNVDFIGKPIYGRQGAGIFGMVNNAEFSGDLSDEYYNLQPYIYQPYYHCVPIIEDKTLYNVTVEKFVYKTSQGWQPGGQGLRLDTDKVINNISKWHILSYE